MTLEQALKELNENGFEIIQDGDTFILAGNNSLDFVSNKDILDVCGLVLSDEDILELYETYLGE